LIRLKLEHKRQKSTETKSGDYSRVTDKIKASFNTASADGSANWTFSFKEKTDAKIT
jgi:hypothetical protein